MYLKRELLLLTISVLFSVAMCTYSAACVKSEVPAETLDYVTSDWGVTQFKFKIIKYQWTITNYSAYNKVSIDYLESPIFPGNLDDDKWQLQLFFKDLYEGSRNVISLFLMPLTRDRIEVKYKFALLNKNNCELNPKTTYSTIHRNNLIGYSNYAAKDYITNVKNNLLVDDTLTILVEIEVPVGFANISGHCHFKKSNASYSDNFLSLLENELFSDAKISVGNHEFAVHRAILASASPVFLSLFKGNESLKNQVIKVSDVEPQIFRELLRFIYGGKVQGIEKVAEDLLPLAEKYGVKQLKILCEEALCRNLTGNTAIDFLMIAQNNNAENLKLQASNYIAAHLLEIMQAPSYKTALKNSHPLLKIFQASIEKTNVS